MRKALPSLYRNGYLAKPNQVREPLLTPLIAFMELLKHILATVKHYGLYLIKTILPNHSNDQMLAVAEFRSTKMSEKIVSDTELERSKV